jgi:uncharacterized protein with HEPN domain
MSSKPRKWKFRIRHILEAIATAQSYVRGMTFENFQRDTKTVDAVITRLMIIGEATRSVPEEVQAAHAEVPWHKMQGLRNVIVHEYDRVDLGILWNVVQLDLPPLVPLLQAILAREPGE